MYDVNRFRFFFFARKTRAYKLPTRRAQLLYTNTYTRVARVFFLCCAYDCIFVDSRLGFVFILPLPPYLKYYLHHLLLRRKSQYEYERNTELLSPDLFLLPPYRVAPSSSAARQPGQCRHLPCQLPLVLLSLYHIVVVVHQGTGSIFPAFVSER